MGRQDYETETLITHALRAEGFDASEDGTGRGTPLVAATLTKQYGSHYGRTAGNNGGIATGHLMAAPLTSRPYADNASQEGSLVAFDTTQLTSAANRSNPKPGDPCHPLAAGAHAPAVAFSIQERACAESLTQGPQGKGYQEGVAFTLEARNKVQSVASVGVRRLTPRECARLQGFGDDHLDITFRGKPAADGPKYKALGNSMAVPCMLWLGQRIELILSLPAAPSAPAPARV